MGGDGGRRRKGDISVNVGEPSSAGAGGGSVCTVKERDRTRFKVDRGKRKGYGGGEKRQECDEKTLHTPFDGNGSLLGLLRWRADGEPAGHAVQEADTADDAAPEHGAGADSNDSCGTGCNQYGTDSRASGDTADHNTKACHQANSSGYQACAPHHPGAAQTA